MPRKSKATSSGQPRIDGGEDGYFFKNPNDAIARFEESIKLLEKNRPETNARASLILSSCTKAASSVPLAPCIEEKGQCPKNMGQLAQAHYGNIMAYTGDKDHPIATCVPVSLVRKGDAKKVALHQRLMKLLVILKEDVGPQLEKLMEFHNSVHDCSTFQTKDGCQFPTVDVKDGAKIRKCRWQKGTGINKKDTCVASPVYSNTLKKAAAHNRERYAHELLYIEHELDKNPAYVTFGDNGRGKPPRRDRAGNLVYRQWKILRDKQRVLKSKIDTLTEKSIAINIMDKLVRKQLMRESTVAQICKGYETDTKESCNQDPSCVVLDRKKGPMNGDKPETTLKDHELGESFVNNESHCVGKTGDMIWTWDSDNHKIYFLDNGMEETVTGAEGAGRYNPFGRMFSTQRKPLKDGVAAAAALDVILKENKTGSLAAAARFRTLRYLKGRLQITIDELTNNDVYHINDETGKETPHPLYELDLDKGKKHVAQADRESGLLGSSTDSKLKKLVDDQGESGKGSGYALKEAYCNTDGATNCHRGVLKPNVELARNSGKGEKGLLTRLRGFLLLYKQTVQKMDYALLAMFREDPDDALGMIDEMAADGELIKGDNTIKRSNRNIVVNMWANCAAFKFQKGEQVRWFYRAQHRKSGYLFGSTGVDKYNWLLEEGPSGHVDVFIGSKGSKGSTDLYEWKRGTQEGKNLMPEFCTKLHLSTDNDSLKNKIKANAKNEQWFMNRNDNDQKWLTVLGFDDDEANKGREIPYIMVDNGSGTLKETLDKHMWHKECLEGKDDTDEKFSNYTSTNLADDLSKWVKARNALQTKVDEVLKRNWMSSSTMEAAAKGIGAEYRGRVLGKERDDTWSRRHNYAGTALNPLGMNPLMDGWAQRGVRNIGRGIARYAGRAKQYAGFRGGSDADVRSLSTASDNASVASSRASSLSGGGVSLMSTEFPGQPPRMRSEEESFEESGDSFDESSGEESFEESGDSFDESSGEESFEESGDSFDESEEESFEESGDDESDEEFLSGGYDATEATLSLLSTEFPGQPPRMRSEEEVFGEDESAGVWTPSAGDVRSSMRSDARAAGGGTEQSEEESFAIPSLMSTEVPGQPPRESSLVSAAPASKVASTSVASSLDVDRVYEEFYAAGDLQSTASSVSHLY